MNKNFNISIVLSSIILSLSMITSTFILINNKDNSKKIISSINQNEVMTIAETAEYLKIKEEDIIKIITIENSKLRKSGSFTGAMFPYFKVNDDYYIYKPRLKKWLEDASRDNRIYDTYNYSLYFD
ncbi:hypothetical protein [Caloranaerobacter sp. DY30410]|uniref:hypothetical protein n=1 Tax=Caloranaerobacter sp. DY30410 TaxID=3238305 RepID=UPI003CFF8E4D